MLKNKPVKLYSTCGLSYPPLIDYQPAQRWLKLSAASDGYSSNNSLHGGKIPRRLASQMVESVWQEYNINRTGNKYVKSFISSTKFAPTIIVA